MTLPPPRAAYLHIPFCLRRCFYCDFPVVPLGDRADGSRSPGIPRYLESLHAEIQASAPGPPLSTVYFGGGTPSLLTAEQLEALLEALLAETTRGAVATHTAEAATVAKFEPLMVAAAATTKATAAAATAKEEMAAGMTMPIAELPATAGATGTAPELTAGAAAGPTAALSKG